jgi:hypothetical protein
MMRPDEHDGTTPAGLIQNVAGAFGHATGGEVRSGSPDLRLPIGLPCGHVAYPPLFDLRVRFSPQGCLMGSRRRDKPRRIMPTVARAKPPPSSQSTPQGLSHLAYS